MKPRYCCCLTVTYFTGGADLFWCRFRNPITPTKKRAIKGMLTLPWTIGCKTEIPKVIVPRLLNAFPQLLIGCPLHLKSPFPFIIAFQHSCPLTSEFWSMVFIISACPVSPGNRTGVICGLRVNHTLCELRVLSEAGGKIYSSSPIQ